MLECEDHDIVTPSRGDCADLHYLVNNQERLTEGNHLPRGVHVEGRPGSKITLFSPVLHNTNTIAGIVIQSSNALLARSNHRTTHL